MNELAHVAVNILERIQMPEKPKSDFSVNHIYRVMTFDTIAKLPPEQADAALSSVKTAKLEKLRGALRTMPRSALLMIFTNQELLMAEVLTFENAPAYDEYECQMIAAAARVAVSKEVDRYWPVTR